MKLFFVYASLVLNVAFALSLFVSHLSFFDSLARLCFVRLASSGYIHLNFLYLDKDAYFRATNNSKQLKMTQHISSYTIKVIVLILMNIASR